MKEPEPGETFKWEAPDVSKGGDPTEAGGGAGAGDAPGEPVDDEVGEGSDAGGTRRTGIGTRTGGLLSGGGSGGEGGLHASHRGAI